MRMTVSRDAPTLAALSRRARRLLHRYRVRCRKRVHEGVVDTGRRAGFFRRVLAHFGSFKHGDKEFMSQAFLKTTGGDPQALLGVLDTFVDTPAAEVAKFDLPVLVVGGAADDEVGSFDGLVKMLPQGRFVEIPGNHMSAVTRAELGDAIVSFLTA